MPKLIDYPRTSYTGAWEIAEVTDDTGGKCAIETAARKLNRKVSGSFKAIIGSAVKFGLLTSKRDLLTTTTLFKRIKHAYDKQEELLFHREAFLTPPLFAQICRRFRGRELPIQMLDIMLIREFSVEEINAQNVAKAFVDGCRMVGILDERNIMADIDALNAQKPARRELSNPVPTANTFRAEIPNIEQNTSYPNSSLEITDPEANQDQAYPSSIKNVFPTFFDESTNTTTPPKAENVDTVASLFGLQNETFTNSVAIVSPQSKELDNIQAIQKEPVTTGRPVVAANYQIQITGPGLNTSLSITEEEDISLAIALLEKIRRQIKT